MIALVLFLPDSKARVRLDSARIRICVSWTLVSWILMLSSLQHIHFFRYAEPLCVAFHTDGVLMTGVLPFDKYVWWRTKTFPWPSANECAWDASTLGYYYQANVTCLPRKTANKHNIARSYPLLRAVQVVEHGVGGPPGAAGRWAICGKYVKLRD